jgi:phasin family protein
MTFAERNMAESFDFATNLVRAKNVEEVLKLQTEYVKKQIAALNEQAKELAESASKAAKDVAGPKV